MQYVTGSVGLAINVSGNQMVYSADQADYPGYGTNAVDFYMSSFRPDPPFTLRFDLAEVDVTDDTFSVDEYIQGVEHMLQDAIKSGSTIGSVQTRIDLQSEFAARLGDSIDSGVGRLVDADMEEASTRLAALQTQQQIAVQSLQIANTNPNNLMTLFQ